MRNIKEYGRKMNHLSIILLYLYIAEILHSSITMQKFYHKEDITMSTHNTL